MRSTFFLLFTASGFSGLIYESIWTHYLKLFLGHAAYAQTLVLAIFMGGMAAGSWLCSRLSGRWRRLLLGYAAAEAAIGLLALGFHPVFVRFLDLAYGSAIPALGDPELVTAFKWGTAALFILPQSILLGMTFPLMSAGLLRRFPERPGETVSMLYFTNSLGGAAGVLASGFWLIQWIGLPGTIALAGVINLVLAGTVWTLAGRNPEPAFAMSAPAGASASPGGLYPLLLVTALVTGLSSFMYEIGWIRMLGLVLGSSTHAFELMLSAFILGLALGGLWIRRRIDGIADPLSYLGWVQVVMGLMALATLPLYGQSFDAMQWMLERLPKTDSGYSWFNLGGHGIALAVMLPATFCAGMTLPLITFTLLRFGRGERGIGAVYGANTIGAIAGVIVAVHLAMPLLGLKGLIALGSGLDMALGVALLAWAGRGAGWSKVVPALGAAVLALAASLLWVRFDIHKMASGVFREKGLLTALTTEVVAHRDGKTATIHLTRERGSILVIRTNGKAEAAIDMAPDSIAGSDEPTMVLAGALPLMLHPQARTAANIGFGSGITSHVMLSAGQLDRVDTIEIEPAMVDLARHFGERNRLAYTDPRSRIEYEDAKTFFSTYGRRYDIIVSEPSNPWVSGVAGLFSGEFYRLVRRHLNPDGILLQWLQLYEIDFDLVASVLKALGREFSDYAIFATNHGDVLVVARNGPLPRPGGELFANPRFARELARVGIYRPEDLELRRVATRPMLEPVLASRPIRANSDYFPVLDQNAAKTRFLKRSASEFMTVAVEPVPALEALGVRRPLEDIGGVVPMEHFPPSKGAYVAGRILQAAAAGGDLPADTRAVSKQEAEGIATATRLLENCRTLPSGSALLPLFDLARHVLPYLKPADASTVWAWAERQPCVRRLSGEEREWFALFRAVGDRDFPSTRRIGLALAEGQPSLAPDDARLMFGAIALGMLAGADREGVEALLARYRGDPGLRSPLFAVLLHNIRAASPVPPAPER